MTKLTKSKTIGGGGEKVNTKAAATAQKLYWEVLVGKKKVSAVNCPESISFDLYKLKAYLNEAEAEFNRLNVPYGNRSISVLPIAYTEKETFSVLFTPSVLLDNGSFLHQFNQPAKQKEASKKLTANIIPSYDFQLQPANEGNANP